MGLIGSKKLRQHVGIKSIALRAAHPIAVAHSIDGLGIDRIDRHSMVQQKIHNTSGRLLNGCPKPKPLGSLLVEPAPDLGQTFDALCHFEISYLLALLITHIHLMQAVAPIHSDVITLHCLWLLCWMI